MSYRNDQDGNNHPLKFNRLPALDRTHRPKREGLDSFCDGMR